MSAWLTTFFLVVGRVGTFLELLPGLSVLGLPRSVRTLLVLLIAGAITPHVPLVEIDSFGVVALALVREVLAGGLLGIGVAAVFAALALAMDVAGFQIGFSFSMLLDPLTKAQENTLSTLASWAAAGIFFASGLHQRCLVLLARSFDAVPPGRASFAPDAVAGALSMEVARCIELGVQLAGPIVLLVWLVNLLIALLSRLAPKMNAFFSVGTSATGAVGLTMVWVSLPWILTVHHAAVAASVQRWLGR